MSRPDRYISAPLKAYILVGGWVRLIWIAMALAVMLFAFVVMPPSPPYFEPRYDSSSDGRVVMVAESGLEIFDKMVMEVEAQFSDADGNSHSVRSYTATSVPVLHARVTVKYVHAQPGTAVIVGMRTHPSPWWLAPLVVLFCVGMGTPAVIIGLRTRRRALALLRRGTPASGTIVEVRRHDTGDGKVWIPVVEFQTPAKDVQRIDGEWTGKSGLFKVGATEALVYDPKSPANATLLRDVPGKPVIDGDNVRSG